MEYVFDKERALSPKEAARFLEHRLRNGKEMVSDGVNFDRDLLLYADKYNIKGSEDEQIAEMAQEAIARMRGVDERYDFISVEALACMDRNYFAYLVDASYSQDTQAPDVVAQGIEACEGYTGNVFTTAELLESGRYIVDDYDVLEAYAKQCGSGVIDTLVSNDEALVNAINEASVVKMESEAVEQMQMDFDEAIEQLSFDLGDEMEL